MSRAVFLFCKHWKLDFGSFLDPGSWLLDLRRPVAFVLILLTSIAQLPAETAYLNPSADTSIMQAFPFNNFGGNEYFNSGTTQNYTTNRGLLKFDIAGALPPHAKVTAVTLTVEVVGSPVDGDTPSTFTLHRMLRDWGEGNKAGHPPQQPFLGQPATDGEATFLYRYAGTPDPWEMPGGAPDIDYVAVPSSDTFIYGVFFSPYVFDSTPQLIADVQSWAANPAENFGWMLICRDETNNFTARRFASREDPFQSPILTIDYFVPRVDAITITDNMVSIRFAILPGLGCRLESKTPGDLEWESVTNIPPQETTADVIATDSLTGNSRIYRLVVE